MKKITMEPKASKTLMLALLTALSLGSGSGLSASSAHAEAGGHEGRGGDSIALEFKSIGRSILNQLKAQNEVNVSGVDVSLVDVALNRAQVKQTNEALFVNRGGKKVKVTARNFSDTGEIEINSLEWPLLGKKTKHQLVMHELCGLIAEQGCDDTQYQISQAFVDKFFIGDRAANQGPVFFPKEAPDAQNPAPADLGKRPEERGPDLGLPEGWTQLANIRVDYPSLYLAMSSCGEIAASYIDGYDFVVCEPLLKKRNVVKRWNIIRDKERFAGVVYENSGANFFSPKMGILASEYHSKQTPVIVTEPVSFNMYSEEEETTYGYRILAAGRRVLNTEPDHILLDSQAQGLEFATAKEALNDCAELVVTQIRRIEYVAVCQKAYKTESGKYAYIVVGKKKYVPAK